MVPSPFDTLHELLAAERRRDVLAAVVEANRPLTRRELTRHVAARADNGPLDSGGNPDDGLDELKTRLYHNHLPQLLDAGAMTRSESDRFAATTFGHDLYRAERAFRAVVGDAAEASPPNPRTPSDARLGADDDAHLVLPVSWAAVEAVDFLVESDDRWSSHPGYDEAIRTAVLEACE